MYLDRVRVQYRINTVDLSETITVDVIKKTNRNFMLCYENGFKSVCVLVCVIRLGTAVLV